MRKTLLTLSWAVPAMFLLAAVAAFCVAKAQEHGPDAKCARICLPSDYPGEPPVEVDGLPTYACPGACKAHDTDPCTKGQGESPSCGEYCRPPCCGCHKAHCP